MATTDIDELATLRFEGEYLVPLQAGYTLSGPYGALVTDVTGGMPSIRRNTVNNAQLVTATYDLPNPAMVAWFQMWYQLYTLEGSLPFKAMLSLGEATPEVYVVVALTAPVYNEFKGYDSTVTFQFAARKVVDDYDYWDTILGISELYNVRDYLNAIEKFAIPDIVASIGRC